MKASALLILLLFPSPAPAQQQYFGRTATSVNLPPPADPADSARLTIHPGEVITEENIRSSIQALYDTGRYRKIAADITRPTDPDTVVTFIVEAQYYFSTFRFEPENLLPRPITSYFQPPLGKKYSKTTVEKFKADTRQLIEETGYYGVTIDDKSELDPRTSLTTVVLSAHLPSERAKIHDISFTGDQRIIPANELQKELKISKNDNFDQGKIDKAALRIRKKFVDKGFLTARVTIDKSYVEEVNGVDLKVAVEPGKKTKVQLIEDNVSKPLISEETLRTLVPIYVEAVVDPELMAEGGTNIQAYYRELGYFQAIVTHDTIPEADGAITVQYTVVKGEKHRVRSIRIVGNSFFSENEILRNMKNRQSKVDQGLFSDELLKSDVRTIQGLYQEAGFRDVEVTPDKAEENHEIDITITIHEGLRYVLDEITFTGNQYFAEPELWTEAGIQPDQIYSAAIIKNARDALAAFYLKHGFSEVRIETHDEPDTQYKTVNVRIDIVEGPKYSVGLILVAGNEHTAETIVTRGIEIHTGDPYNPQQILEAQQKLYSLGIFDRVDIVPIEQDTGETRNLLIQVEETKRILVTPGVGVTEILGTKDSNGGSSVNAGGSTTSGTTVGPRVTLEVSNINLRGLNQTLALRLRAGYNQRQIQASYRNPRVFRIHDNDYLGIASISFDKTTHVSYKASDVNISLQLVRKLNKSDTLLFSPRYDTVNLQDIRVNPNLSKFPNDQGIIQIGRLDTTFIRDRRSNPRDPSYATVDPSSGVFSTGNFQIANKGLGSEVNFFSLYNQTNYYFPIGDKVIATSARLGWKRPYAGDVDLPISERYFAGGSSTLRGFKLDDAGPPAGGQLLVIGNIEYRMPLKKLPTRNFFGALFYDTGNVFETPNDFSFAKLTHTVGVGLRYKTPLGPIRVDLGHNLRSGPQDRKYRVFFTLGHAF